MFVQLLIVVLAMKSKDIVIVGVLLGIGAIVRLVSLVVPGAITSNLVIAFYALAIALILPTMTEAIGIGLVAGIICALISHSVFPPANLISEPIGALVALGVIKGAERFSRDTGRKDNIIGYILTAISALVLIVFGGLIAFADLLKIKVDIWTTMDPMLKIGLGLAFVVLLLIGLYLIPNVLRKYKAGVTALIATLASGFTFAAVAAFVIVQLPGYLNQASSSLSRGTPPVDAFILGLLPIVIGCAIVNFVIAQVLYIPAKKAMR
jgi:hypothetical protein